MIDLGKWAAEEYRVPEADKPSEDDDDAMPKTPGS
jgi:endogenous inhibitor of DNA gyrase (YacG/DUF329 family)